MGKHTPGPWHIGGKPDRPIIYGPDGFAVADSTVFHGTFKEGETKANARLISEAPTMLIGLKKAAGRFRAYEILHLAKGTEEAAEKARANKALADELEGIIRSAEGKG